MAWIKTSKTTYQRTNGGCRYFRHEIRYVCESTGDIRYGYWNEALTSQCGGVLRQKESDSYPSLVCPDNSSPEDEDDGDSDGGSGGSGGGSGGSGGSGGGDDDSGIIDGIIDAIEEVLNGVLDEIKSVLDGIGGTISALKTSISNGIDNFIAGLMDYASSTIETITDTISGYVDSALDTISSIASNILYNIDNAINSVFDSLTYVFNEITSFINRVTDEISEAITGAFDDFVTFMEETFISVTTKVEEVFEYVIEAIDSFLEPIILEIDELFNTVGNAVDSLFISVSETIDQGIQNTYEAIEGVVVSFSEAADELSDQFADITGGLVTELDKFASTVRDEIGQPFADLLDRLAKSWFMQDAKGMLDGALSIFDTIGDPYQNLARYVNDDISFSDLLLDPKVKTSFFGIILASLQAAVAKGMLGLQSVNIVNHAKIEKLMQDVWTSNPVAAFSMPEAVSIHVRGFIDEDTARSESLKSGYNPDHFTQAKLAAEKPLEPERAISAFLRGFIDEDFLKNSLQRQGFNQTDSDIVRRLGYVHPPVQDLITMAVREVFSPDIARRFELFGDLPEQFVAEAEKGGLSKEWAEKYWGAHWRLPSAQQGFEMLHRGFIDEDTLDMLIKALDVSPFWRAPLKSIAYNPVTRVDIRRMLKLGVIDEDETLRRYKDLGYNDYDAGLMTQFAVSLLPDDELDDEVDIRELTRTQIKTLYLQGTYSKSEAIDQMEKTGYAPDTAILLVGSWETALLIKERNDLLSMVVAKAVRENLTVNELEASIFNLQLTSDERDRIGRELLLRSKDYTSVPSKSELLKMVQGDIINMDDWRKSMNQLGYSDTWVDRYAILYGLNNG